MIEVEAPGLFTTVQDLGRPGYGPIGVSTAGAADAIALRLGNRLALNREGAAALEMTLVGGSYRFGGLAPVALAGADFDASVDGAPFPVWTSRLVRQGQTLTIGPTRSGARCYLCMGAGIEVPLFLGSASTHVMSGLGGFEGRPLRKGDRLEVRPILARFLPYRLNPKYAAALAPVRAIRVTRGPQWRHFSEASQRALVESPYVVTEEANRTGLRLAGPALDASGGSMITEGVPLGAIQVAAGGQPIILFVEQQTTGGYPKIASIIAADLSRIGQLRPRDEIRFELVTYEQARHLYLEQERMLLAEDLFLR